MLSEVGKKPFKKFFSPFFFFATLLPPTGCRPTRYSSLLLFCSACSAAFGCSSVECIGAVAGTAMRVATCITDGATLRRSVVGFMIVPLMVESMDSQGSNFQEGKSPSVQDSGISLDVRRPTAPTIVANCLRHSGIVELM